LSDLLSPRIPGRLLAPIGLVLTVCLLIAAHPAHAAFPGANGKITFDRFTFGGSTFLAGSTRYGKRTGSRLLAETDQIWTINPDGSGAVNVSNTDTLDEYGTFSADGTKIAYDQWTSDGKEDQIWSMNTDGSAQTDLTNDTGAFDDYATWSPDGTRVAFVRSNDTTDEDEIWVMNADGSNQHLLVTPDSGASDENPNWSPDGTKITFARVGDSSQIYVANADGSGTPQNVSNDSDWDSDPNWSPDGTKLAFGKQVGGDGPTQIWVMNADGSSQHVVVADDAVSDSAAAWSPDGTQIAYQRSSGAGQAIWVVAADGSNNHQVSSPEAPFTDYEPDWQPVGTPASSASLTACTPAGSAAVHAADPTGFISPLTVHYKVDGGAEQTAAADGSGNVAVPLSNGAHTIEFWASDGAGYVEAAHHTASTTVDTITKCVPPAPKVSVAGVRRACVSKAFNVRVRISSASKPKSVRVFLGSKRILSTTKTSFTLHINPKKLSKRTRLRIVATDASGKVTTLSRTIARCAVAKPRRHASPRFTG
jgi:Tol biopolymer transport system component